MAKQRFDETQTGGEGSTPQVGADSTTNDFGKTGAEDVKISKPADNQEEVKKTQQLEPVEVVGEKKTEERVVEPENIQPNITEDKQPSKTSKKGEDDYSIDLEDETTEEIVQEEPEENKTISPWFPDSGKSIRNPVTGKWIDADDGVDDVGPTDDLPSEWFPEDELSEDEIRTRARRIAEGGAYDYVKSDGSEPSEEPVNGSGVQIIKTLEEAQALRDQGYGVYLDGVKVRDNDWSIKNYLFTRSKQGIEMRLEDPEALAKYKEKEEEREKEAKSKKWKEQTTKSPRGGQDVDGVRVYGYPTNNNLYVRENGLWYRLREGEDDLEVVESEESISQLNKWHEIDPDEKVYKSDPRAATLAPPTTAKEVLKAESRKRLEEGENAFVSPGLQREIEQEDLERERKSQGDVATQVGRAIEDQGLNFDERTIDDLTENPLYIANTSEYLYQDLIRGDEKFSFETDSPANDKKAVNEHINKSLGVYDGPDFGYESSVDRMFEESARIVAEKEKDSRAKLENFQYKNLSSWADENGLGEAYKKELIDFQVEVKEALKDKSPKKGTYTDLVGELQLFLDEIVVQQEKMKDLASSGENIGDYLASEKTAFVDKVKNTGFFADPKERRTDKSGSSVEVEGNRTERVFYSTLAMRDYIEQEIESGTIIRDDLSGRIEISPDISSSERSVIESTLQKLLNNYQDQKVKDDREMSTELHKKRRELSARKAEVAKLKREGNRSAEKDIEVENLKKEIEGITLNKKTILMSDPNSIVDDIAEHFNDSQKRLLRTISLDEKLTPKQKFDLFYQELKDRTDKLAGSNPSIGTDYWGQVVDKLQDVTSTLSDEELEFYENYATLRKLGSLYATNEGGYSDETSGFWDSFMQSLIGTFFPKTVGTSKSFGIKSTEKAVAINHTFEKLGIKDVDLIRPEITEELKSRMTPAWWGTEGSGSMIGTTTGIIFAMMSGGAVVGTGLKLTQGAIKLLPILEAVPLATRLKNLERIDRAFTRTLNKTRLGRYIASPVEMGIQFETTGRVFPTTESYMSFKEGFISALAAKGAMQLFSKMSPIDIFNKFMKTFGVSSDRAAEVVKNLREKLKQPKALHYAGVGELIQESTQELVTIYRDELRTRGFWDEVNERFGKNPSNAVQLFVASYTMGAALGLGNTELQQDMYESLTEEERELVDSVVAELFTDNAIAEGAAEAEIVKILNEQRTGETDEEVSEGEIVRANSLEEAQRLWDEGYRADGVDNRGQLEGMFATGRPGIDMKKPSAEQDVSTEEQVEQEAVTEEVSDTEVAEEQDLEQEEETPVISLADRIRAGKLDTNVAAVLPIPGFAQAWNLALEGTARGIEGVELAIKKLRTLPWYQELMKNSPEKVDQVEAELERLKNNTSFAEKWSKALESKANKKGLAEKASDQVKRSAWYKGLNEEQKKSFDDKLQKKVDKINEKIAEAESQLSTDEKLSDKIATIKSQNRINIPRSQSQVKADVAKAAEKLDTFEEEFNMAYEAGVKAGKDLGAQEQREKQALKDRFKDEIRAYAREVLPDGDFAAKKKFIGGLMSDVQNTSTELNVQKFKEKIDKKAEEFYEKQRVAKAESIKKTLLNKKTYVKGKGKDKTGAISVESRAKLEELIEQKFDSIDSMNMEQLEQLEEQVAEIISEGRGFVKGKEEAKRVKKKTTPAKAILELAKLNKTPNQQKSGEDIMTELGKKGSYLVVDGERIIESEKQLDDYLEETGRTLDDLGEVTIYTPKPINQERYIDARSKIRRAAKRIGNPVRAASRSLTARAKQMKKGSIEVRKIIDEKIVKPFEEATYKRNRDRMEYSEMIREKFAEALIGKKTFRMQSFEIQEQLAASFEGESGEMKVGPDGNKKLTIDDAAHIYLGMTKGNTEIEKTYYQVGGQKFVTKSEAERYAERNGFDKKDVTDVEVEFNVQYAQQLSRDGSLQDGLEVARELIDAVENGTSDSQVKTRNIVKVAEELLNDEAWVSKVEDTYERIYNMPIKKGDYYPRMRNFTKEQKEELPQFNLQDGVSVISNSLNHRPGGKGADYEMESGVFQTVSNYFMDMVHTEHMLDPLESSRELLSNEAMRGELAARNGEGDLAGLEEQINNVLSNGKSRKKSKNAGEWAANQFLTFKVLTTLAFKIGNAVKQVASMGNYYVAGSKYGVSTPEIIKESGKIVQALDYGIRYSSKRATGTSKKDARGGETQAFAMSEKEIELLENILFGHTVMKRLRGGDLAVETRNALSKLEKYANQRSKVREKAGDVIGGLYERRAKNLQEAIRVIMSPTIVGDVGAVVVGGVPFTFALYNSKIEAGWGHEEAMNFALEKFHRETHESQQSSEDEMVSKFQSNELFRLITTFKTSQIQAMGKFIGGLDTRFDPALKAEINRISEKKKKQGKDSLTEEEIQMENEFKQSLNDILWFPISSALFFAIGNGLVGAITDDEPRKADGSHYKKAGGELIKSYEDLEEDFQRAELKKDAVYSALFDWVFDMVQSNLQGMGVPGAILDSIFNTLRGRDAFNNIPIQSFFQGISDILSDKAIGVMDKAVANRSTVSGFDIELLRDYEDNGKTLTENIINNTPLKNLLGIVESMQQYADGAIGFGDAFMGRTLTPEEDEEINKYMGRDTGGTYYREKEYRLPYGTPNLRNQNHLYNWLSWMWKNNTEVDKLTMKEDREFISQEREKDQKLGEQLYENISSEDENYGDRYLPTSSVPENIEEYKKKGVADAEESLNKEREQAEKRREAVRMEEEKSEPNLLKDELGEEYKNKFGEYPPNTDKGKIRRAMIIGEKISN